MTLEDCVFSCAVASTTDAEGQANARLYLTQDSNSLYIWMITSKRRRLLVKWFPPSMRDQAAAEMFQLANGPYEEILQTASNPPLYAIDEPSFMPDSREEDD